MSQLKYWVWLASLDRLRSRTRVELIEEFGSPDKVFFANEHELGPLEISPEERAALKDKKLEKTMKILERCQGEGVTIITLGDAAYPVRLRNIYDPPCVLYVKGRLPVIDEEVALAVVGTRKATPYGIKMGRRMGYELTRSGALVVSGLAEGVDTAGAEGALRAGGSVIGVLGTAIDEIYPRKNAPLFQDVAAVGAIVSEYAPGAVTDRRSFPARNRIISGLSVGVVIIEAPKKSGSLITASHALEQGREVFVVPGNVDSANCVGSNELLRDCAKAVASGWDVLCEFTGLFPDRIKKLDERGRVIPQEEEAELDATDSEGIGSETGEDFAMLRVPVTKKEVDNKKSVEYIDVEKVLEGLSEQALKIVAAIDKPLTHIDDVIERTELPASEVLAELTMLEIDGIVTQEKGKRFSLNISGRA